LLSAPRVETALRRPLPSALELLALLGLLVAAAVLVAGAAYRPATILTLVLGGAAVLVFLLRTDLALLLVVASAPLEGAFASGPAGISVTKLAGGLAIASFTLTVIREKRVLVFERGQALVLGILGLAMLSAIQAQQTGPAVTTTVRYGSFAAVYLIFSQVGHDLVFQRRIAWTLTVACSISSALGLEQYLSNKEQLATLPYVNQNDFAFVLATSLPFMFFLLSSSKALRPLVMAAIALVSAGVLLSLSRGAFVGLAAGFLLFVITDKRRVSITLAAGALAAIGVLLVIRSNPGQFHQALQLKQNVAQQNISTRFGAWGAAARLASQHPFLGVGPGNFQFHYNQLTGQPVGTFTLTVAHNALLDIAAEVGLIAMCLLAAYLVLTFVRLTTSLERGYGDPGFVRALRISLTIAVVSAMFLSEQYFLPFWLIGGLAAAIWVRGEQQSRSAE
jgi:O-antigen ligase